MTGVRSEMCFCESCASGNSVNSASVSLDIYLLTLTD